VAKKGGINKFGTRPKICDVWIGVDEGNFLQCVIAIKFCSLPTFGISQLLK
jgi:hypothetical protein